MKILVYDDNPDYGGHQVMAVRGIQALAADPAIELHLFFNPQNKRLKEQLKQLPNLRLEECWFSTKKLQGVRNRFSQRAISTLSERFRSIAPDRVLCIQGEIEDSSLAVLAARHAGIHCISYLAIPHRMQQMGAKLGFLRDRTNHYLLNQPSRYIVISESMATLLCRRGCTVPVDIVHNGISAISENHPEPSLEQPHTRLGMLGRIEFNQKQHHFMVGTFCAFPEIFKNCHLLIAGSGPDEERLDHQINQCSRSADITRMSWQNDPEAFFSEIDFLLLPSRFEGVPLVMLEAIARGIPVLGSRCDGMKDLLPAQWTFTPEDAKALAETFNTMRRTWRETIGPIQEQVRTQCTLESFHKAFHKAVTRS